MDIHIDPLGGWAGDMFVAAMLDAFPEHEAETRATIDALRLGAGANWTVTPHKDHIGLMGKRFRVAAEADAFSRHDHARHHHHDHDHDDGRAHGHQSWRAIRDLIESAPISLATRREALAIFSLLAEAEGQVHGVPADEVRFHEVGAVDSIVDIVAAASLITSVNARRWTSGALPLGSGRVPTAHGWLPAPAPATALLLRGLDTIDDGVPGERVTPTGAAIARRLVDPRAGLAAAPRKLARTGTGFGARELPGVSNCLRVLAFEEASAASGSQFAHRELAVIQFEVDDQSAEDLAAGLDHLRAVPGVHDVIQAPVFGKKGRLATQIQVLVAPERMDAAIARCFAETTTIGLRFHIVRGAALPRAFSEVAVQGLDLRVKSVERPGGPRTAKAEASDVATQPGHENRARLRREAEALALAMKGET